MSESMDYEMFVVEPMQRAWDGKFDDPVLAQAIEAGDVLEALERAQQLIRETPSESRGEQNKQRRQMVRPDPLQEQAENARRFVSAVLQYDDDRRKLALMLDDLRKAKPEDETGE